jgi:hypothetical protein
MTTVDDRTRAPSPPAPLTPLLRDAAVSWEVFDWRYGPLPRLVDTVLAVVPNCDR